MVLFPQPFERSKLKMALVGPPGGDGPPGGGGGGWRGDGLPPDFKDEEEEEGAEDEHEYEYDLRRCHSCGKRSYVRKGLCINKHCVQALVKTNTTSTIKKK